jgi:Rubrerythrin
MGIRGLGRLRAGAAVLGTVALLAVPVGVGTAAADPRAERLHPQTRANLWTALEEEALAYATNRAFAVQADLERLPKISNLYDRSALTERQHFTEQAKLLGLVKDNAANLRAAIEGTDKAARTYRRFAAEAKQDGDHAAARLFTEIGMDEADHRDRFKEALDALLDPSFRNHIPTDVAVKTTIVSSGRPKVRSERTLRNLRTAMRIEALSFMLNVLYANHAQATGRQELATLFRRVALVDLTEHFAKEATLAGLVAKTKANLCTSIAGESHEGDTMYPRFAQAADRVGDHTAAELFADTGYDELRQARAFARALSAIGGRCSVKKR